VSVVPTNDAAADLKARTTLANTVEANTLSWLPGTQVALISTSAPTAGCPGTTNPGANTFSYMVSFTLIGGAGGSLFPSLVNLPMGLGTIPPLPAVLSACAVAFT